MEFGIEDVKKRYEEFEEKYSLPKFEEINNNFEIDRIERNSFCFLRTVRKNMMEVIGHVIGFFEMLLNPVNVPRAYFPFISSMGENDKKKILDIYGKFTELSLLSLEVATDYSEEKEAELIKKIYSVWKEIKPNLKDILSRIRHPVIGDKKVRDYFG